MTLDSGFPQKPKKNILTPAINVLNSVLLKGSCAEIELKCIEPVPMMSESCLTILQMFKFYKYLFLLYFSLIIWLLICTLLRICISSLML